MPHSFQLATGLRCSVPGEVQTSPDTAGQAGLMEGLCQKDWGQGVITDDLGSRQSCQIKYRLPS